MKQTTLDLIKNINENTFIPATTQNELFELFQLDTVADLRKVSRNFMKVYELLEHFDNQTSNATTEKEGIVKFGTEAGNAIDAETWKQAIGQTLGGYISKVENKEAGKWYINDLTDGKIYKCIQNHSSTSFDITKFVDITNIGLSDKLENLYSLKIEKIKLTSDKNTVGEFELIACGNIRIIWFTNIYVKNEYETIFALPDWFCKKTKNASGSCANGTGGAGGEVAEIYLEATFKSLRFFPALRLGFNGNLQLSGQIISIVTD